MIKHIYLVHTVATCGTTKGLSSSSPPTVLLCAAQQYSLDSWHNSPASESCCPLCSFSCPIM